jgi:hypothetical protein
VKLFLVGFWSATEYRWPAFGGLGATLDLISELNAHQLDELELDYLLLDMFPIVESADQKISYARPGESWALKLVYAGELLVRIDAGPGLKSSDFEDLKHRIEQDLLPDRTERVGRGVLFASYPVRGAARVADLIQLLPVPAQAFKPPFLFAEHPFVLEFKFRPSTNAWVHRARRAEAQKWLGLFMNVLVDGGVRLPPEFVDHRWTLIPEGGNPAKLRSEFLQTGYYLPDFSLEEATFSSIDCFPGVARVNAGDYRSRDSIFTGRDFELPDDFDEHVGFYFRLSWPDRERFKRAIFWFSQGLRVQPYSPSAHFVALITAIKALMPDLPSLERCSQCGKELGSATQRFINFVESYYADPLSSSELRRRFYNLRSRLSHGDIILRRDEESGPPSLTYFEEQKELAKADQTAKNVIPSWLCTTSSSR